MPQPSWESIDTGEPSTPKGVRSVRRGAEGKVPARQLARRLPYFIVTANSRQVLEEVILPRIAAFLLERGVRLSAEKTVITPLAQGFDF